MSRALVIIKSAAERAKAARWIAAAPWGTRVEFKTSKRSHPQNDLLWARLTEISLKVVWHGQRLTPTDWKDIFTAALKKARVVPNIDGDGFVLLGLRTSTMTKQEMTALLDLIDAFAVQQGVTFAEAA